MLNDYEKLILKDLQERRDQLNLAISKLETEAETPNYVSNLDFKAIEREANGFKELLNRFRIEREKKERGL